MIDRDPAPPGLGAVRGRPPAKSLDGVEKQLGERARRSSAHGRNSTTKVTGDPATTTPLARRATAVTTAESGADPVRMRTCTTATPTVPLALVRAVSLGCNVTAVALAG